MSYILDEKEIEKIIKQGKFDADKYATQYCVLGWTLLDMLASENAELICRSPDELDILDKEEINNALCDMYNYSSTIDTSDVYDSLIEGLKLKNNINKIIKIKGE